RTGGARGSVRTRRWRAQWPRWSYLDRSARGRTMPHGFGTSFCTRTGSRLPFTPVRTASGRASPRRPTTSSPISSAWLQRSPVSVDELHFDERAPLDPGIDVAITAEGLEDPRDDLPSLHAPENRIRARRQVGPHAPFQMQDEVRAREQVRVPVPPPGRA